MQDEANQFRKFAAECIRLAEVVRSDSDKAVLLNMAQVWIRLANQGYQAHRPVGEDGVQPS
jgi:hypothetical protein